MSCKITCLLPATLLALCLNQPFAFSQAQQLVEPMHRVENQQPAAQTIAAQPAQVAARIAPPAAAGPIDLTPVGNEHPLMPAVRMAKDGLVRIDATIQDYSAMMIKEERIDGVLNEKEVAFVKVRHQPFSVYCYFLKPHKGRECLYNDGPNAAKGILSARDCGFRKRLGVFDLDPEGRLAMANQKYPIMKLGVRNLMAELAVVGELDTKFGECEVQTKQSAINGRAATLIEVVHPVPRENFRFHKAEIFMDNELKVPVRFAAYMWPANPGEQPPLEEAYTYLNIKMNNGFTDADFDKNNTEYFK
jgi:hypothetical protein